MNIGEVFDGVRAIQIIRMPDGGSLVLGYVIDDSAESNNKNIFRVNVHGEIVWQVQRDEQGKRDWATIQRITKEAEGHDYREPFMNILLVQPDGTRKENPDHTPLKIDYWTVGCRVYAGSLGGISYELDIGTGVARNIYLPGRPW